MAQMKSSCTAPSVNLGHSVGRLLTASRLATYSVVKAWGTGYLHRNVLMQDAPAFFKEKGSRNPLPYRLGQTATAQMKLEIGRIAAVQLGVAKFSIRIHQIR